MTLHRPMTAVALCLSAGAASAANYGVDLTIDNPDPVYTNEEFGFDVDVYETSRGRLVAVSSVSSAGTGVGEVRFFEVDTGTLVSTYTSTATYDYSEVYSHPVSLGWNYALIGSPIADTPAGTAAGQVAAHYFTVSGGGYTIRSSAPQAYANFGYDVSKSGNWNWISSPYHDDSYTDPANTSGTYVAADSGIVELFQHGAFHTRIRNLFLTQNTNSANVVQDNARFGISVDASNAYAWRTVIGTTLNHLVDGATASDPNVCLVSEGCYTESGAVVTTQLATVRAFIYNPTPGVGDRFGWSTAISEDASTIIVGAPWDDEHGVNAGAAYLFDAVTGALTFELEDPDPNDDELFGYSVDISGNLALVGTADETGTENGAYVFDVATGDLIAMITPEASATGAAFAHAVALWGDTAVIASRLESVEGFYGAGSVSIYSEVPAPAPALLLGGALGMMGLVRRRRG